MKCLALAAMIVGGHAIWASPVSAQYSAVTAPFNSASSSYFEQFGVSFGFRTQNFFFEQNSQASAIPPFGGFTAGAGANLGFAFGGDGGSGFINISASQGSRTSLVSQTPSITLTNGLPGAIFDTTLSPFVVSVIPVVNDAPSSPLAERLERIKSGEQPGTRQTPASNSSGSPARTDQTGDPWQTRLKASQHSGAAPTLSVAEIRRRKAAQPAKDK